MKPSFQAFGQNTCNKHAEIAGNFWNHRSQHDQSQKFEPVANNENGIIWLS
jgi:hypothetical protein